MAERALIVIKRAEGRRTREVGVFGYIAPASGSFEESDGRKVFHEGFTVVLDDSRGSSCRFVAPTGEIFELMTGEPEGGQWLLRDDVRVVRTLLTSPRGV